MPQTFHESQSSSVGIKVNFTGDTALKKGMGLCYDFDTGTATAVDTKRRADVELPSATNNMHFAGVTAFNYVAKTGGQSITIIPPGETAEVAIGIDAVLDARATCSCGSGDPGRFDHAGAHFGRGSCRFLQTNASGQLDNELPAATSTIDTTGLILTDTNADFVTTSGVAVDDFLIVVGGERNANNSVTAGKFKITAVTATAVTVDSVISDGGTLVASWYIISGNPTALALLEDGAESGLVQYVSPLTPGTAADWTTTQSGHTEICAGWTITSADSQTTLADGIYHGQLKSYNCLGAVTTSEAGVIITTGSFSSGITSATAAIGALATFSFNAASESASVKWSGAAWELQHTSDILNVD